jgi:glycosyltransferase involved in cell wall biosynthesis
MSSPLVSVLMPVYNREKLVIEAIRSIQSQTLQQWELIILDDASTDGTLEVCRSFTAHDQRIRVMTNEKNIGVGASRNRLLSCAIAEYVAVQDSDDISEPDRLALEVEVLRSKPEIGIVSGVTVWADSETAEPLWYYPAALHAGKQYPQDKMEMVKLLYIGCEVANAACMFRRSLVEGFPDPYGNYRFVDDWYFFLRAAHRALFWGIPRVLVKMRRGQHYAHLWQNFAGADEAKRLAGLLYKEYKNDPQSPINFQLYRRSVSTLLTSKGIHCGGWKGFFYLLEAILWAPHNQRARKSLREFSNSGFRKRTGARENYSEWLQA